MTRRPDGKRNPRYRSRTAKPTQTTIERAASLRELSHASPSKEDTDKLIEEASNSSDRNSSIILCSYLERSLIHLIQTNLKLSDAAMISLLKDRDGPFSSFYSNIIFAKELGLIDKDISSDLDAIRRIRNAFAHTPLPIDFTTSDITRDIEKFRHYQTSLPSIVDEFPQFTQQRKKFYACFITLFGLISDKTIKQLDESITDLLLRRYYRTNQDCRSCVDSLRDKS
jgi:hypothetical protein